jgi:glucan 1,3-beta-glucosidase
MRQGALPSRANQALVLEGVVEAAKEGGWKINLIEAFDQPWKRLLEGTVGGYWGVFDDGARAQKFHWGIPVSNYPEWRLQAGLGIVAAFLVFAAAWFFSRGREVSWTHSLGVAAIALASGIVFGWAVTGLPMEPPEPGDRLRSALMIALSLIVPITAGAAVVRGVGLGGAEIALNKPLRERGGGLAVLLSLLFAATLVAAIHVALGLVFDPRYKDFQLALLSGPVTALAILALLGTPRPSPGMAERVACGLLTAAGLFVIYNEGIANWQALWFGVLLAILALTALRTSPVPG